MGIDPNAILALVSDLVSQVAELERENAALRAQAESAAAQPPAPTV